MNSEDLYFPGGLLNMAYHGVYESIALSNFQVLGVGALQAWHLEEPLLSVAVFAEL
jgi:hypothetical protein